MKKILTVLLSFSVVLSIASISSAAPNSSSATSNEDTFQKISSDPSNIIIYNDGNGNFAFTSNKSADEKKEIFKQSLTNEKDDDVFYPQGSWFAPKRISNQDGTKNQVGTVWSQFGTDISLYKGALIESDQIKFAGSSRSMFDGSIKATKITHGDTFSFGAVTFGAEMSGFPPNAPSIGITVQVTDRSGTVTIEKSGSEANTNYIDHYYSNIGGSAYKITSASQTTSATYMIAGSGISASTSKTTVLP